MKNYISPDIDSDIYSSLEKVNIYYSKLNKILVILKKIILLLILRKYFEPKEGIITELNHSLKEGKVKYTTSDGVEKEIKFYKKHMFCKFDMKLMEKRKFIDDNRDNVIKFFKKDN